jgi:anti-sigma-K factor RskA
VDPDYRVEYSVCDRKTHSESAPGPIFRYAVSNLFHRLARTNAAGDHSSMASWSCQRGWRATFAVAVVIFAILAVLATD